MILLYISLVELENTEDGPDCVACLIVVGSTVTTICMTEGGQHAQLTKISFVFTTSLFGFFTVLLMWM